MTEIVNTTARTAVLEALLVNSHSKTAEALADSIFVAALRGRANAAKKSARENAGKEYDAAVSFMRSMKVTTPLPQTRGEFMNAQVAKWEQLVFDLDEDSKGQVDEEDEAVAE